jgi:alpha-L-rhamnosidase
MPMNRTRKETIKQYTTFSFWYCLIACVAMLSRLPTAAGTELTNLRCEYRENPMGIDAERPRLSWKIEDKGQGTGERGQKQTAYQVLVTSSERLLREDKGDLWDSGKVASDQSLAVRFAGTPLISETRYWWKVRVWDEDGRPTA